MVSQKTYICMQCKKRFQHNTSKNRHIKTIHTGKRTVEKNNKTFDCNFCDHKLKNMRSLQRHLKEKHENNSVVIVTDNTSDCQFCDKSFKHKTSLNRHVRDVHDKNRKETSNKHMQIIKKTKSTGSNIVSTLEMYTSFECIKHARTIKRDYCKKTTCHVNVVVWLHQQE
ncbi:unnamed protein product [Meganyctiphanes norvegica]|uniref:C2H2-type domain-containing protein n=1 Tax=Meganyctiphanes norvegica TaxID=48144 RepID=A0AAV2QPE9_MEGNR